ncbi:tRNA (adenosine(37)-N6)-threonylcarbamoyltransferase complex dimerization subunit type 1 TsaB [Shewanella gelidimarina]|uniref:tRNA (adenosine(37)-N6)-threonylcarbamoyltransferase complex dimerization subunit type 1 TsaB n=1 Tax=Shewanella gelidimarina TaxID=56813 RepID=UPI00200CA1B6|nr:tRNA (adenosine(37)-N6)-threonylcarbamoyltransferase complex dimerization subunit type 1 TsaB [Shewanella gelidimarina]MCL1058703.1 tRNA (adenosine(37)-N6)-threonylcarbamoyltransferase complex dimerization subunit type 1 TsaB [Shewanella gelidimarina]
MTEQHIEVTPLSILALDTCTESCSAALTHNSNVFSEQADAPREHSQRLLPMVKSVLSQADIKLTEVDLIAYGRGPGSFTGIRICTSITQGLALGQSLPVIGISTLATMAQAAIENGANQVLAAIDARMGEVYWGQYINVDGVATLVNEEVVSAPEAVVLSLNEAHTITACGTGFDAYPQLLALAGGLTVCELAKYPDAKFMAILAQKGHALGLSTSVDELTPVYLRDTVTWKKLPGKE